MWNFQKEEKHTRHILLQTVAFLALAGIVVLLFFAKGDQPQPSSGRLAAEIKLLYSNDESALSGFSLPLPATANAQSAIAVLGNDQNHDGNYDGISDPLAALGLALIVCCMPVVLESPGGDRLLLAFCELPILISSDYYSALEQPD